MGRLYDEMMGVQEDENKDEAVMPRRRLIDEMESEPAVTKSADREAVSRTLGVKDPKSFLAKTGDFLGAAGLAPAKAAVGALNIGQKSAQWLAKKFGASIPEKGSGVLTDVLVHGGELGMDLLKKEQEKSPGGAFAGDVALAIGGSAGYGAPAATASLNAVKAGKVLSAAKQGAIAGAKSGAVGGGMVGASEGESVADTAGKVAVGGLLGGATGAVLSGLSAGVVKSKGGIGDMITRHRLSQARSTLEKTQADELLYGQGVVKTGAQGKMVPLQEPELKALQLAEKTDLNPGDAGLVREANVDERRAMDKMFKLAEKNIGSRAPAERPIQLAGKSIVDRLSKIDELREAAGSQLDEAIQAMPDQPIDVSVARDTLISGLEKQGVKQVSGDEAATALFDSVMGDNKVKAKNIVGGFDFSKSRFKDNSEAQKIVVSLWDDLADGVRTPEEIVNVRRRLFDLLDLAKDKKDIVGPIEGLLGKVREELDTPLVKLSPEYAKAAQEYAMTRSALSDWYKKVGMKFVEGERPASNLKAAEIGRRILGNASADYVDMFDKTDEVLRHFGVQQKVDPRTLLRWNAALEDLFGTTQSQSLRGQVGGGVSDALSPAIDVATGGKTALVRKGAEMLSKATGKTKEAQREAMRKVLDAFMTIGSQLD